MKKSTAQFNSPIFNALKEIHSYKFVVWYSKTFNPSLTYQELADKFHISDRTAFDYYHEVEGKIKLPLALSIENGMESLDELWLLSYNALLQEHNPIATVEYGKGRGFLKLKLEIDDKRSPEEFKKNLIANTSRLLGSRVDMTEAILITETVIDLQNDKEGAKEPQGEEIKAEVEDSASKPKKEEIVVPGASNEADSK